MIKNVTKISFAIIVAVLLISCKNAKQKMQEYVVEYNKTAASFKADNVTLTTARGYINNDKVELRFETDLEQNAVNKKAAATSFRTLLKDMINKNQIPKELVENKIQFDTYFLAEDNTVLSKEIINTETLSEIVK
ncbi:hypothetical protein [Flavobacterium hercynium]|uniref:Uncharacterized protein n=1 Tax=Flavobacterium hercynium TaxID=387094 RepID=A0A226GY83_9FLAO|nr:hypothetical protein [Flavobacterium hercynium]OXA86396.1 hypothetical protein B0A66_18140 [Flavobacterium hercynium]SMP17384.1 hypothetical protein SAMN06265346_105132 [Flavobacterium hercynium]